jgi:hypothetical protein
MLRSTYETNFDGTNSDQRELFATPDSRYFLTFHGREVQSWLFSPGAVAVLLDHGKLMFESRCGRGCGPGHGRYDSATDTLYVYRIYMALANRAYVYKFVRRHRR